jgi:hypothetical protein
MSFTDSRSRDFLFLATLLAGLLLLGCNSGASEKRGMWRHGDVVSSKRSPVPRYEARVLMGQVLGQYEMDVRDLSSGKLLAERDFFAPVGYQSWAPQLEWEGFGHRVTATLPHDFTNSSLSFTLRLP